MDRQLRDALEAVYEQPDDDDRRRVVGDCFLERGHPWGALIARQLSLSPQAPPSEEELRLSADAAPQAFGPLWPLVVPGTYRFERGFPVECALLPLIPGAIDLDAILGRPEWATLERVAFDERGGTSGAPAQGRSLVAVRGLDDAGVEAFLNADAFRLRSLGLRASVGGTPLRGLFEASQQTPLSTLEGLDEETHLPPKHGLQTLGLRRRRQRAPRATAELLRLMPSTVSRVVLSKTRDLLPPPQSWLSFERDGPAWRLHARTYGADGARMIADGDLDGIPLTFARIDMVGDDGNRAGQLERLRPWMVIRERAPCPFEIGALGAAGYDLGPDAWHARPVLPHPPWLVGPPPLAGRRVFP